MSSAACCASSTWGSRRSTPRRTWTCWLTVRRSEEHTSELQSRSDLVCRLLLEKKKKKNITNTKEDDPYHQTYSAKTATTVNYTTPAFVRVSCQRHFRFRCEHHSGIATIVSAMSIFVEV